MSNNYRYIGKTSRDAFLIKGINVYAEKWKHTGGCATVTNPQTGRTYVFSKYESGGIEFVSGKDKEGYQLFFVEVK